jgi:hypothetical protein
MNSNRMNEIIKTILSNKNQKDNSEYKWEIQQRYRNPKKRNQIKILEVKSKITQIKTQLKASLIEWNKLKMEYQRLKKK